MHWAHGWLPIAQDSAGWLIALDLDPGMQGAIGQVLFWDPKTGPELIHNSFVEFLEDNPHEEG